MQRTQRAGDYAALCSRLTYRDMRTFVNHRNAPYRQGLRGHHRDSAHKIVMSIAQNSASAKMKSTMSNAKKSFWKSRTFFVLLFLIATPPLLFVLLVVWVNILVLLPNPPLVISKETTRVIGPLTDEGYIDFLKALEERFYPPELTTDENGFRIFVRQFGDGGYDNDITPEDREFYRRQIYEKLALDPDVPPTMTLPQLPHEIVENFEYGQLWTLEDYPMLADWVNDIDEPLDALAEMICKPVFFAPLLQSPESSESGKPQSLIALDMPDLRLFRDIGRVFSARAVYRIGQGNIDDAIGDKLTLHRLGRLISQKGHFVGYLVGIAVEGQAIVIPVGANPEHPLTKGQIVRVLEGLAALPPRRSFSYAHEWERYIQLGMLQDMKIALSQGIDPLMGMDGNVKLLARRWSGFNWNIAFRQTNETLDTLPEMPRAEFLSMVEAKETKMTQWTWFGKFFLRLIPDAHETLITDLLFLLFAPTISGTEEAVWRAECSDNMQRLVLAVLLYHLEHGTMPDEHWATQIKQYLGENPEQYFSCPSNPSPKRETTYALIQYDDTVPENFDTLLLVELKESVPFDKATITVDDVLARKRIGSPHSDGMITARRSGAVGFLSMGVSESELSRLLGRSEK